MAFARGDIVRCIDPAAYSRVQRTLICCDGCAFTKKADDDAPAKDRRPFVIVDAIEKSDNPRRPKLILLISISTGLPSVGGQRSFLMGINYLCCDPDKIPYKEGSYIVYGLGAAALEADLEHVWSRQAPDGAIQKVSLMNLSAKDQRIHNAAMDKAWKGRHEVAAAQWKRAIADVIQKADKKAPSQPELAPAKE